MPIRRADDRTYTLATAATASGAAQLVPGGEYMFMVEGTVGGATISLQAQNPNGTWCDISIYAGTIVKSTTLPFVQTGIDLPNGNVRMAVTGGAPSGLNAYLVGLG